MLEEKEGLGGMSELETGVSLFKAGDEVGDGVSRSKSLTSARKTITSMLRTTCRGMASVCF